MHACMCNIHLDRSVCVLNACLYACAQLPTHVTVLVPVRHYLYTYVYIPMCTYAYLCTPICTYMYLICTYMYLYVPMYTHVYPCMYLYVPVCVPIVYTYIRVLCCPHTVRPPGPAAACSARRLAGQGAQPSRLTSCISSWGCWWRRPAAASACSGTVGAASARRPSRPAASRPSPPAAARRHARPALRACTRRHRTWLHARNAALANTALLAPLIVRCVLASMLAPVALALT